MNEFQAYKADWNLALHVQVLSGIDLE